MNVLAAVFVVLALAAILFFVLPVIEQRIDHEHFSATAKNHRRP